MPSRLLRGEVGEVFLDRPERLEHGLVCACPQVDPARIPGVEAELLGVLVALRSPRGRLLNGCEIEVTHGSILAAAPAKPYGERVFRAAADSESVG
jgi:hypothetical protein